MWLEPERVRRAIEDLRAHAEEFRRPDRLFKRLRIQPFGTSFPFEAVDDVFLVRRNRAWDRVLDQGLKFSVTLRYTVIEFVKYVVPLGLCLTQ